MALIQIVGFALVVTGLVLVVRENHASIAFLMTLFAGVVLLLFAVDPIVRVLAMVESLAKKSEVNLVYFQTIVKMIGIAYVAEFGAQIIRDAQLDALASKVELIGKLLLMVLALPIFQAIIETVMQVLPL